MFNIDDRAHADLRILVTQNQWQLVIISFDK